MALVLVAAGYARDSAVSAVSAMLKQAMGKAPNHFQAKTLSK